MNKADSTVGVIIEAKKPTNKAEMLTKENINAKAFQELVLYYLRERITQKNLEVKHLVATNINEWFVFDANVFEKLFAQNKNLVKQFTDFEEGRLAVTNTDFFYKEIAAPVIEKVKNDIEFTWFNIQEYDKILRNTDKEDDNKLVALFKLFSPEHLLKLPFTNDSNSLDKSFYTELLHIIGLKETKEGSKKLIGRKAEKDRNPGSLLENTITILKYEDCLRDIKASDYGKDFEDQLFNVALELVISWINRILFLKLLEGQLVKYHAGDKSYRFLATSSIPDYDALNKLFFQVLAIKESERNELVKKRFGNIPYLNSSLFEPNALEHKTIRISNLEDEYNLPIISSTVLKDKTGKKLTGEKNTLEYLFDFLDAYDFASEGAEAIQEENKTLINASVLGLIFEKINGYKDGSFFTPGFITMYMSRETIRRAVVQKFNEVKGWDCKTIDGLYDKIEDRNEANEIVNSLKICDPAVGSGHFLVSSLNEIIAIKNDLKILQDRSGKRLKEYQVEVVNDELVVTDEDDQLFDYKPTNKESQRIQETLFHEKQTIIENCLFGVDINPNSVKICRLRLWIELLKNAYYKPGTEELETLPNIDINIKIGNSLISRYALDADIKEALKNSKWTIDSYRNAVNTYRYAENKEQKREMERLIESIKNDFESEIASGDKRLVKLNLLKGELLNFTNQPKLFEQSKAEKEQWNKKVKKLTDDIKKLETELEEIRTNKIYENAFEWRFEFPEVLNDDGDFVGFDVVIGNPPYIRIQDLRSNIGIVDWLNANFNSAGSGNYDLYVLFIELAYQLLSEKGEHCYIVPHKFTNAGYGKQIRNFINERKSLHKIVHFGASQVFEDATTYTGIFCFNKQINNIVDFYNCPNPNDLEKNHILFEPILSETLSDDNWVFISRKEAQILFRLSKEFSSLDVVCERIFQGLKTSADKIYILKKIGESESYYEVFCSQNEEKYQLEKETLFPLIKGGDSRKYKILNSDLLILFPYRNGKLISSETYSNEFPYTWKYLNEHKEYLENREKGKMIGEKWYGYVYPKALSVINQPKLFTPDIAPSPRFSYDVDGAYMFTGGVSGGYGIIPKPVISPLLLLAILNSTVTFWYIKNKSTQMRGGWYSFESRFIKDIPIPKPTDKSENIQSLVNEIISLKQNDKNGNISNLKSEIDQLVYQLYGLTEEEIRIVEEAVK
jgi:adenine-specific DNA-methyltransferase